MPPTGQRGHGPTSPRDFTGRKFAQQQKALDKTKIETDPAQEIKRAYDKGWDDAIAFVMESYLVFEKPEDYDEDEDTNNEVN
jgi:hypothetical protein